MKIQGETETQRSQRGLRNTETTDELESAEESQPRLVCETTVEL